MNRYFFPISFSIASIWLLLRLLSPENHNNGGIIFAFFLNILTYIIYFTELGRAKKRGFHIFKSVPFWGHALLGCMWIGLLAYPIRQLIQGETVSSYPIFLMSIMIFSFNGLFMTNRVGATASSYP